MNNLQKIGFFQKRGILFNLFFLLYLFSFQPLLLREVSWIVERGQTNFWLGMLMIFVIVVETVGIFWKTPAVAQRLRILKQNKAAKETGFGFVFLVWIFHTVIAVSVLMIAFNAFGVVIIRELEEMGGWIILIFVGMIVKELIILLYWMDQFTAKEADKPANQEQVQNNFRKEIFGDIALLIFGAVAFTSIWEFIAVNTPILPGSFFSIVSQYILAAFLCLIFFLPIRSLYIFEEYLTKSTRRENIIFWGSLLVNILFSLTIIPGPI